MNPRVRQLIAPTPFETWVRTMKAWAIDPTTPLDHLPPLTDETFTPATYQRLLVYVKDALETVTQKWLTELGRALSTWRTPFELAHDLVQLRASLARRVQLSRHPSLPPAIRTAYIREVERAIRGYQADLEESVATILAHGHLSTNDREQVLRALQENSFLRVLDMAVTQGGERQAVTPLPVVETAGVEPIVVRPSRFTHRRLHT